MREGDELEIQVTEGRITIEPMKNKLTLESLVAKITPETRHKGQDWRGALGREVW